MKKFIFAILSCLTINAWAGSSLIDLTGDYQQVFRTPSGNILCGGDSLKRPNSKLYAHDLYCFVYENKAMPKSCKQNPNGSIGLDVTLNRTGKAKIGCAGFEFEPYNEGEEQTRILHYGETIKGKDWSCQSEKTGLRCQNNVGRGFELNRRTYRLF